MKPGFALSLSFEGISLLHRAAGGWRTVGEVSLGSSDLNGDLTSLKDKAGMLESGALRCKLIIPNDQIRYIEVETGSFSGDAQIAMVRRALDSATPYPVEDLAFDISNDGPITYVAAVARETLVEAEAFAVEHGFNPVSFVAAPGDNPYLGEPFFGPSTYVTTLPDAPQIEPDGIAVVVIGPVEFPKQTPEPTPAKFADLPDSPPATVPDQTRKMPSPTAKTTAEPNPTTPVEGFSSRRRKVSRPEPIKGSEPETVGTPPPLGGAQRHAAPTPAAKSAPVAFKSSHPRAGKTDRPAPQPAEPDVQISVTAPTLDIPDVPEPKRTATATSRIAGFLSRRKSTAVKTPISVQASDSAATSGSKTGLVSDPVLLGPELIAISPSPRTFGNNESGSTAQDEAARMTVFGARGQARVGGKPRYLGLVLTVALLVFLAVIAVWASIFLDKGVAGLFRSDPAKKELAAVPDTPEIGVPASDPVPALPLAEGQSNDTAEAIESPETDAVPNTPAEATTTFSLAPTTDTVTPDVPPPQLIAQPDQPPQPVVPTRPSFTETDAAVLEALRQPLDLISPGNELLATPSSVPEATTKSPVAAVALMQQAPQVPDTPSIIGLDDLYIASIDRTDLFQDAVALPPVRTLATDHPPGFVSSPAAPDTAFDLDQRGLVLASVEGTINPDGVMIYLGRPAVVPPKVPTRFATNPNADTQQDRLAGLRPRVRPNDLAERNERSNLGGLTRAELSGLRPKLRPQTLKQEAELDTAPTAQAVVSSRIPKSRPRDFDQIVTAAVRIPGQDTSSGESATGQTASIAPISVNPKIPTSASVARQATLKNAINLRRVNLIGVYGTPSNRRALVRLPSGRYKKVKVGDTVDGGRVVAIGDSELRYQKRGRNLTLKIPSG